MTTFFHRKELIIIMKNSKHYDKKTCFENIRTLLKKNPDIKIGQIEKEAGLGLGYMSRLEKDNDTTEPSLNFITTAAKMLDVSIDTLLFQKLSELTSTDDFLLKFLEKVIAETKNGTAVWVEENIEKVNVVPLQNPNARLNRMFTFSVNFDGQRLGFYLDLYEFINPETDKQYIELWTCNKNCINNDYLAIAGALDTNEELDILAKELFDFLAKKPKIVDSIYREMLVYLEKDN